MRIQAALIGVKQRCAGKGGSAGYKLFPACAHVQYSCSNCYYEPELYKKEDSKSQTGHEVVTVSMPF